MGNVASSDESDSDIEEYTNETNLNQNIIIILIKVINQIK